MDELPKDVLERVFSYLPLVDVVRSISVCKHWNQILASIQFLRHYSKLTHNNSWLTLIHDQGDDGMANNRRLLNFYDPSLHRFYELDLSFLPPRFILPVAASRGLICVAESNATHSLCLCNPLTKKYRMLPPLYDLIAFPVTLMIEDPESESHKILIMADGLRAYYSPHNNRWIRFGCESFRPRSPVMAFNGVIYGLEDVGSAWHPRWRLASLKIDDVFGGFWSPVRNDIWDDIFDIVKEPRLIKGRGDCLLMAGGLKSSLSLNSACSTFVILELDLNSLEWDEAGRMPMEFFHHFDAGGGVNIFGGIEGVYFSSRKVRRLVFWDFSDAGKGCWSWVDNPPEQRNVIRKTFPFDPRLDSVP